MTQHEDAGRGFIAAVQSGPGRKRFVPSKASGLAFYQRPRWRGKTGEAGQRKREQGESRRFGLDAPNLPDLRAEATHVQQA